MTLSIDQPPLEVLAARRLVPVISLHDAAHAGPMADALVAGGLPVAEVTFRTPAAEQALRTMADRGDLLPIAGTVLTTEQASRAVDAGARMIVSPGTNPAVLEHALRLGVAVCPGVCTPTEIESALSLGLDTLKFFPAEAFGGAATVGALAAPFRGVRFVPTGGVSLQNLAGYLAQPSVVACGGSWMVAPALYEDGRFHRVEQAVREAVRLAASLRADEGADG